MRARSFDSLMESYERLLSRPNPEDEHFYNGLYTRFRNPILTREHIPPFWMYDANPETNPFMMQRLGVNATLNSGAIKMGNKYCLVVRVEGMDRKSFFAVAESDRPRRASGSGTGPFCCRTRRRKKPMYTTCG